MNQTPPDTDQDIGLGDLLRRAAENVSERDLRELRVHLLAQLFVLFKSARIRELDNEVFDKPVERFCEVVEAFLRATGQPIVLRLINDEFYIDEFMARALNRAQWEQHIFLKQSWKRIELGEIDIKSAPTDPDVRALLTHLAPRIRAMEPPLSGIDHLGPFNVHATDSVSETEAEFRIRARERLSQSYSVLLLSTGDMLERLQSGRSLALREVRRALQDMVTDSEGIDWMMLGIAELDALRPDLVGHLSRTAVYSIVIARAAGLSRLDIMQISLAALCHDLGRLQMLEDGRHVVRDWAQNVEIPLETVQRLMHSQGMDESAALRTVSTYEYMGALDGSVIEDGGRPVAVYSRPRPPTLAARIIAVADAFDTLRFPAAGRPGYLPDARIRVLLAGRENRFDPVLVNLLHEVVGTHPPGSLVRLADGRHAVVTQPAKRPAPPDRPTVVTLLDRNGEPLETPEELNLAAPESSSLLLLGQVDAQAVGINVCRAFRI